MLRSVRHLCSDSSILCLICLLWFHPKSEPPWILSACRYPVGVYEGLQWRNCRHRFSWPSRSFYPEKCPQSRFFFAARCHTFHSHLTARSLRRCPSPSASWILQYGCLRPGIVHPRSILHRRLLVWSGNSSSLWFYRRSYFLQWRSLSAHRKCLWPHLFGVHRQTGSF